MTTLQRFFHIILAFTFLCMGAQTGHVMINGTFSDSKVYPGTERTFQVYIPNGYVSGTAACLYVGLDGVLCNAPAVIDSLIATGDMPMTLGIFLQPGVIKDAAGNVVRYNRSNEFDATDDRFVTFLERELIPAALRLTPPDGRTLRVSDLGSNRMIFGLSSGGIASMVAAWHRPDVFGRVFSGVGTFVSMRGGNDLQVFVRKCEPKPIKVFLQDGTNDAWNPLFGHWYEGNRMLATALDFAGYDARYDWGDGGHNVKRSTEIFGQVMKWMWQGYPEELKRGNTQNDCLAAVLTDDREWHRNHMPTKVIENDGVIHRTATYPDGSLLVTTADRSNFLWQYTIVGDSLCNGQRFYYLHSYDNSQLYTGPMTFDADGWLYVVTNAGIQICDQNGRVRGILELPHGIMAQNFVEIEACDGRLVLRSMGQEFYRALNIKAPQPGTMPKSQGQG